MEPDKGIGPLFSHLKAVSLGMQRLFLPLHHIDRTSENMAVASAVLSQTHDVPEMEASKDTEVTL